MSENFIIKCQNCGHNNIVYLQDMDFDSTSYEKQMGLETEHHYSHEFTCKNCEFLIDLNYSAWEYPIGCFETSNIDVSGGNVVSAINETEMFQEKLYDFDEDIGLYIPQNEELISSLNIGIAKLILEAEKNPELITHIDSRVFEEFIGDLFKRQGFTVELTQRTRDGGKDIIAIRSDLNIKVKYLIECKRYAFANPVGVNVVRQLYGTHQAESVNKSVVVTTSKFTSGAIDFANQEQTKWQMSLIGYKELVAWIKKVYGDDFLSIF